MGRGHHLLAHLRGLGLCRVRHRCVLPPCARQAAVDVAAGPTSPWTGIDELEIATAEYIDWFNHRRLHGEIGMIPPVELEENDHHHQTVPATADAALASL